jgi:hypothetical protein
VANPSQYTIRPSSKLFVEKVEQFARKSFLFSDEIALLVDLSEIHALKHSFDELIFQAKFVSRVHNMLERIGLTTHETAKLELEFKQGVKKVTTLIQAILEQAPESEMSSFSNRFLLPSQENFHSLLNFLQELSWVKNYILDHSPQRQQQ